jgi:hypothetical protein
MSNYRENPAISGTEVVRAVSASVRRFHAREFTHLQTVAMNVGTYAHALVLEPESAREQYAAPFREPEGLPTNATEKRAWLIERGIECKAALKAAEVDALFRANGGPDSESAFMEYRKTVTGEIPRAEEWERAENIASAVLSHPAAKHILSRAPNREREIYWTDPVVGIACKGKIDAYGNGIICDLKTGDAEPWAVWRKMYRSNYILQFVHYIHGLNENGADIREIAIIGADSHAPYDVSVLTIDACDTLQIFSRQYEEALRRAKYLKNCEPVLDGAEGYSAEAITMTNRGVQR